MNRLRRLAVTRACMGWLVLAILLAPAGGHGQEHCAPASSIHANTATPHHSAPLPDATKDSGDRGDCPHCPEPQCETEPSCSAQVLVSASKTESGFDFWARLRLQAVAGVRSHLRPTAPPTPPPQPLV